MSSLEIGLQPDEGAATYFKVSPDTEVVQVEPGERDLAQAKKVRVTDLSLADRVLVTFVTGMPEARRIVLISATDISKRNEAERLDWQKRGVNGTVTAIHGEEITVRTGAIQGTAGDHRGHHAEDHGPPLCSGFGEVRGCAVEHDCADCGGGSGSDPGRQVHRRRQVDGEDIVYGTFRSAIGMITAIDSEARKITIADLVTKKPMTIRVTD